MTNYYETFLSLGNDHATSERYAAEMEAKKAAPLPIKRVVLRGAQPKGPVMLCAVCHQPLRNRALTAHTRCLLFAPKPNEFEQLAVEIGEERRSRMAEAEAATFSPKTLQGESYKAGGRVFDV